MILLEKIQRILKFVRTQNQQPSGFQISELVKFHPDNPVYARIVSPAEYYEHLKSLKPEGHFPIKSIDSGEWLCLLTTHGLYTALPISALERVGREELDALNYD